MKFNLIGSTAHWNISSGNAAHYIKRLDIPGLSELPLYTYLKVIKAIIAVMLIDSLPCQLASE